MNHCIVDASIQKKIEGQFYKRFFDSPIDPNLKKIEKNMFYLGEQSLSNFGSGDKQKNGQLRVEIDMQVSAVLAYFGGMFPIVDGIMPSLF